jgi:cytochrome c-type biogenesis protein CcmF
MLSELGNIFVGLALFVDLYAVAAVYRSITMEDVRWRRSGRNAVNAAVALLGLALLVLVLAFTSNHFEIQYVAQHSSRALPIYLKVSALWAGQEGSLLLWSFLQALFAALAIRRTTPERAPYLPWATIFLCLVTAFFVIATLFFSNPFVQLAQTPTDGRGMNPLLRHPGMIFHPPAMYVGYVGLAVPFAFALAALVTGRVPGWTKAARSWTLIAWLGLGLGLLLGMRWAYDVLGWGGYWGWDPVENAGLMPWFTATALLHGAVMQEERRGFQVWNILLAIFSFALVLFGTFATRSGMIQSVHAYARSNLGGYYLAGIGVTLVGSLGVLFVRRDQVQGAMISDGLLSRDGAFFLTLILFVTLTVSVFVGSTLPSLTSGLTGQAFEAGPAWFDRVTAPQFALLVLLIGLCPLLGRSARAVKRLTARAWWLVGGALLLPVGAALWGFTRPFSLVGFAIVGVALTTAVSEYAQAVGRRRRRRGEAPLNALWHLLRRQRRKYGGYLVHVGVILMALGVIGTRMYPFETPVTLATNGSTEVAGYTLRLENLTQEVGPDYLSTVASVAVSRGGDFLGTLAPRINRYTNYEQTFGIPAVRPGVREDLYLILSGWSTEEGRATLQVHVNALANFLWLGGLLLMMGGVLAFYPRVEQGHWGHIVIVLSLMALLLGAVWAMWIAPQGGGTSVRDRRPQVGEPAPAFRLSLLDGTDVRLEDLRGQVVVLNIWSSQCPPCLEELPALQATWAAYQDREVVFIGAASQDARENVEAAVAEFGLTYPIGLDQGDRIATAYGITGVPETFVIDPQGRVAHVYIGPVTEAQLRSDLAQLVGP